MPQSPAAIAPLGRKLLLTALGIAGLAVCYVPAPASAPQHASDGQDAAPAERTAPPHPSKVASVEGITEYRLENGLRLLLCPDASRTTITVNMTYLVGSRHEVRGEHGMAHLLEHMLTRSTPSYESIMRALEDRGADQNADTWFDRTHFIETVSASDENLEFVLHLEAERMVQARLTAEDLAQEMAIVTNEFELIDNDPETVLSQQMMSTAYTWHGYGAPTIGTLSDIRSYSIESLRHFYETYYQPDNAVLVIAGKFEVGRALELATRLLGTIPRPSRSLAGTCTAEPTQQGPRRVTLQRGGEVALASLMYHVPALPHPDAAALQILADILVDEPSGRLYTALVETGLASSVSCDESVLTLAEPGILGLTARAGQDQDARGVLSRMTEVVEGMPASGVTAREVERAKGRRLKAIRRTTANTRQLADELTEWVALGDWRIFYVHRDRLREVTVADVTRVARQYLVESNRTSGLFLPTSDPVRATIPPTPDVSELVRDYQSDVQVEAGQAFVATPENIDQCVLHMRIASRIDVALLPKATRGDLVVAEFRFHFGSEQILTGHTEALRMLPTLLQRGTRKHNYQQLRDEIDRLQSEISVGGGVGTFGVSIESDRAHIASAIALAAEILQQPSLAQDQFEIIRNQRLAAVNASLSSPQERCFNALRQAVYPWPADSLHYIPTLEQQIERLNSVTLDEIRDLYARCYGGGPVEVSVVGAFDTGEVLAAIGAHFGSWTAPADYERVAMPHLPIDPKPRTILTPDKAMAVVALGTALEMRDDHPDYPALRFASYVLAESAKSRLYGRLRFQDALSYHVGGALRADSQDRRTSLFVYAFCSPERAPQALAALREEVRRWIDEGITGQDLAASKKSYAQEFSNRLTDDAFIADLLVSNLEVGRKMAFEADMIDRIEALTEADLRAALKTHLGNLQFVEIMAGDIGQGDRSTGDRAHRAAQ